MTFTFDLLSQNIERKYGADWLVCEALFFYEILVAAGVECSSRIVEVVSCYEIPRARNFLLRFATFCVMNICDRDWVN